MYASLAFANLVRTPGRTIVRVVVLAAAVALVGAMILFIGHSLRTMTSSSVRSVPLDWQAPVASRRAAEQAARAVAKQQGVLDAVPAASAPFAGATHVKPGAGIFRSASGSILAVPQGYTQHIHTLRFLRGSLRPGQVVLDQQLAATLQAAPGDFVTFTAKPGRAPVRLRVSGILVVTAGDILFQPLNPLLGPALAQPPVEIAVMTVGTFAQKLAPQLPTVASSGGLPGIPGSVSGTQWQVQAQVDPAQLTGGPAQALRQATGLRNRIQSSLPGQVSFVDNLSESLNVATGDALYAETLYIMLALPGALIALGLAYLAALGTVERDRRELSLLRARGASRRGLVALAGIESLAVGIVAGVLGSGIALLALRLVHVGRGPFDTVARRCDRRWLHRARRARRRGSTARRRRGGTSGRGCCRTASAKVPQAALAEAVRRHRCVGRQRPRLLAHCADRLLGCRQSRLEPDALALDLHVSRARVPVAGCCAATRSIAGRLCSKRRRAGSPADGRELCRDCCSRAPDGAALRSTAACSSWDCCSPSA